MFYSLSLLTDFLKLELLLLQLTLKEAVLLFTSRSFLENTNIAKLYICLAGLKVQLQVLKLLQQSSLISIWSVGILSLLFCFILRDFALLLVLHCMCICVGVQAFRTSTQLCIKV